MTETPNPSVSIRTGDTLVIGKEAFEVGREVVSATGDSYFVHDEDGGRRTWDLEDFREYTDGQDVKVVRGGK